MASVTNQLFDEQKVKSMIRKPSFHSSFIQYWYSQNWATDRWEKEIIMLKNIGIYEIIIQTTADTKSRYAVYFTKLPGFTHAKIDMLETALTAADKLGIKVRIGLGFSEDWWKKFFRKSWLNKEASLNKSIIKEFAQKYGKYASFSGWYIPHEFSQFTALTKKQQKRLNYFFKSMASEIKRRSPKDIMVAPFYHGKHKWAMSPKAWSKALKNILKRTGISIVALQDSIGAGFSTMKQLPEIFSQTKKALNELGIKFYVDVETFESAHKSLVAASQQRIEKQLSIAQCYAEGFVAFSISHYQNKNEPGQAQFYNDYYDYYKSAHLN